MKNSDHENEYQKAYSEFIKINFSEKILNKIPSIKMPTPTANGVTASVIKYCTFRGWHAERVNVTGRQKYDHKTKKMVWIKTNSRRGSADIHAIIEGKAVMIEVKVGKDRMSDLQKEYAASVQKAGGEYLIIHSFDDFYNYLKTKNLLTI